MRDYCVMYDIIYQVSFWGVCDSRIQQERSWTSQDDKTIMFKPRCSVTPKILNAISEIAEIKAVVERSRVLPLNEAQLKRQAIVRMVHTSTSIEGNKLAEYQVDKVLSGMSVAGDAKSILEVKNIQKAIKEMEVMVDENKPMTINNVLHLHSILMRDLVIPEKNGHFRKDEIYVIDDLGDGRELLRYQGPPPTKVPFLVNELLKWVEDAETKQIHPIVRAAILHMQFVKIHPFTDGNGRMARLLTAYSLYKDNWDFRKIIVLEDYYNRNRMAYYNALSYESGSKVYSEGEDLTLWLEYFTEGFLVEARKVAEAVAQAGFGKVSDKDEQVFLDKDELRVMDFVTTVGKITSADVVEILGVAKRTAQLKLKELVDKDLLKPQGSGPSTYYILK